MRRKKLGAGMIFLVGAIGYSAGANAAEPDYYKEAQDRFAAVIVKGNWSNRRADRLPSADRCVSRFNLVSPTGAVPPSEWVIDWRKSKRLPTLDAPARQVLWDQPPDPGGLTTTFTDDYAPIKFFEAVTYLAAKCAPHLLPVSKPSTPQPQPAAPQSDGGGLYDAISDLRLIDEQDNYKLYYDATTIRRQGPLGLVTLIREWDGPLSRSFDLEFDCATKMARVTRMVDRGPDGKERVTVMDKPRSPITTVAYWVDLFPEVCRSPSRTGSSAQ